MEDTKIGITGNVELLNPEDRDHALLLKYSEEIYAITKLNIFEVHGEMYSELDFQAMFLDLHYSWYPAIRKVKAESNGNFDERTEYLFDRYVEYVSDFLDTSYVDNLKTDIEGFSMLVAFMTEMYKTAISIRAAKDLDRERVRILNVLLAQMIATADFNMMHYSKVNGNHHLFADILKPLHALSNIRINRYTCILRVSTKSIIQTE